MLCKNHNIYFYQDQFAIKAQETLASAQYLILAPQWGDSLGIEIYNRDIAQQKLNYIHFNPVSGKWQLSKNDLDYYYSSAKFYETGIDEFGFLKNIFATLSGS